MSSLHSSPFRSDKQVLNIRKMEQSSLWCARPDPHSGVGRGGYHPDAQRRASSTFSTYRLNGLPATRTPTQVLYLAFANKADVTKGGSFPQASTEF